MPTAWHLGVVRRVTESLHDPSPGRAALLLALLSLLVPAQTADAAQIQIGFRPQNGDVDPATEWAVEMISDTPIGSTGVHIPLTSPATGFTSWNVGGTPVVGLPGVLATLHALEDSTAPWGYGGFDFYWFGPGALINAGPGFSGSSLGPVDTWLGMGMLHGATRTDIMYGEGVESGLWADSLGGGIPASDVSYTLPELHALMLLGLGLSGLAVLRR